MATIVNLDRSELQRRRRSRALQQAGYRVLEASNELQAVDFVVSGPVDLIVCGAEQSLPLLGELRWAAPWIPLICVSSSGRVEAGLELAAIVLESPVSTEELVAWVDTELMLHQAVANL
ncbi:response regulator [bacterium CPR1]|nr:response regulator [bacterium CPR1]